MDLSLYLSILHSIFVKGTDIEMEATCGVEASELYPEVKYTSTDEYLNQFLWNFKQSNGCLKGFLVHLWDSSSY